MKSSADEIALAMMKSEMVKTAGAIRLSDEESALNKIALAGQLFEDVGLVGESKAVNHLLKKIAGNI
jgi:hypothetical protein